jgi:hypothetical protein
MRLDKPILSPEEIRAAPSTYRAHGRAIADPLQPGSVGVNYPCVVLDSLILGPGHPGEIIATAIGTRGASPRGTFLRYRATMAGMLEKHYTIKRVAELLQISRDRAWRMVKGEPGVLRIAPEGKPNPRQHLYRIAVSVLQRIRGRNANPPA